MAASNPSKEGNAHSMPDPAPNPPTASVRLAIRHALGWLVAGNAVGLWLCALQLRPSLAVGDWTYGRWVPVHLNVQLFGWTSLPLVALLLWIYEVDRGKASRWGATAVWAWTTALAAGALCWLDGRTSGKIFLDWRDGSLWGLVAAMTVLWLVLAAAWKDRAPCWNAARRWLSLGGLAVLATVPAEMVFSASPKVYPPVDPTTGGPTGASLLGSTLVVIPLMLLLPRFGSAIGKGRAGWGTWVYLAACWVVFAAAEWAGGTHWDFHQIGSMAMLLPWVVLIPWDWDAFQWPAASAPWRKAVFLWWALLTLTGVGMYVPGLLDRIKFTHGLVAHSHVAMAGFTTSFCCLLLTLLADRAPGGRSSLLAWHSAALAMVATLAVMGLAEGGGYDWMLGNPWWRTIGLHLRACCGAVMLVASGVWYLNLRKP